MSQDFGKHQVQSAFCRLFPESTFRDVWLRREGEGPNLTPPKSCDIGYLFFCNVRVNLNVIGQLIPAGAAGTPDIVANRLKLTIQGGVDLETQVNKLDLNATDVGSIIISNANALTIENATTADGSITVSAAGDLIAQNVRSLTNRDENDIQLSASAGNIELGLVQAVDYAAIQAESDAIRTLTDGATLASLLTLGDVILNASGSIGEIQTDEVMPLTRLPSR